MTSPTSLLSPTSLRNLTLLLRTAPRYVKTHFQTRPYSSSSPSVSPTEISHFNALASTWWDPNGSSRLLHLMNPLRHDFIHSCHTSQPTPPPPTLRYLDIGCGGGIFAESAARLRTTSSVIAIDPSPEVLSVAKAHAKRDPALVDKLRYVNTSIERLPIPQVAEEQVDILTVFEVIEHVENPSEFLDVCARHVKPGGWIIMSTIARHWISWLTTKVVAEDLLRMVPRGTHDWAKYINEEELRGYFESKGGWNSPRSMGVIYVPGLGWREVSGSENVGNYFFGVRKDEL